MGRGWIKLHRQSVDNPLYKVKPFDKWHAWEDILLSVCHEQQEFYSKGELVKLEPGQMITSYAMLANRWGWSIGKVRRFLSTLTGTGMSTLTGTPNGTVLTVENWAKFQGERHTNEHTNRHSNEHADGTLTRRKEEKKREGGPKAQTHLPPFSDRSSIVDEWVKNIKAKEGTN